MPVRKQLRVMTYNVHSCIGRDKRADPNRIAEVIGAYKPDIVALQELDMDQPRSEKIDQPHKIAQYLDMQFHFHCSMEVEEGRYGNALLSRYPIKLQKAAGLPRITGDLETTILEKFLRTNHEPRGVIWAEVDVDGCMVQAATTHLGLTNQERALQVENILSAKMLGQVSQEAPVIFLGDFNDTHRSNIYARIIKEFRDVQAEAPDHKRCSTFFSRFPLRCLDHVFVKGNVNVLGCQVPSTALIKEASDHLPVIADLEII